MFLVALITIGMMLLYAVPGFLMVKSKLCVDDHISAFSKLLLFVCQPGLIIYSMRQVPFSYDLAWNMFLVFLVVLVTGVGLMSLGLLLLKKKMKEDARFRIYNIVSISCWIKFIIVFQRMPFTGIFGIFTSKII